MHFSVVSSLCCMRVTREGPVCLTTGEQNSYSPDFQRYSLDLCHMPMKHAQSKNAKKKILYLHNVVLKHVLVREWWSQNSPILYKSMNGCGPTGEEQRCGCRNVPKHNLNSADLSSITYSDSNTAFCVRVSPLFWNKLIKNR